MTRIRLPKSVMESINQIMQEEKCTGKNGRRDALIRLDTYAKIGKAQVRKQPRKGGSIFDL